MLIVEDDLTLAGEICRLCERWGFAAEYLVEFDAVDREYVSGELVYDKNQGALLWRDEVIEMTKSENKVLTLLADHKGEVVERESLMRQLWSTDEYVTDASLTMLVSRLRSKIISRTGITCIHTKKGKGYWLE